jgi:hypothetical protein
MPKAVVEVAVGAAIIGAAALTGGAALAGLGLVLTGAEQATILASVTAVGATSVMSGISDALAGNQGGLAVGVTNPIGPWGIVYGTQKVGGVEIFRESNNNTGVSGSTSNDKQLHRVYCLASHPCALGSWQLRIDGKQVLMAPSGSDWVSYSPTQVS